MLVDEDKAATIQKILSEEYGITSEKELDEAIAKLGKINVTPFVSPLPKRDPDSKNE